MARACVTFPPPAFDVDRTREKSDAKENDAEVMEELHEDLVEDRRSRTESTCLVDHVGLDDDRVRPEDAGGVRGNQLSVTRVKANGRLKEKEEAERYNV